MRGFAASAVTQQAPSASSSSCGHHFGEARPGSSLHWEGLAGNSPAQHGPFMPESSPSWAQDDAQPYTGGHVRPAVHPEASSSLAFADNTTEDKAAKEAQQAAAEGQQQQQNDVPPRGVPGNRQLHTGWSPARLMRRMAGKVRRNRHRFDEALGDTSSRADPARATVPSATN